MLLFLGNAMSSSHYQRVYRNLSQKILNKIVKPQVLGNTDALEQQLADSPHTHICYVLQHASTSNTILIDQQAQQRGLGSVFAALNIADHQEDDSMLVLNESDKKQKAYHYSAKLIRLIEALQQHPEHDIQLVPVSILWGRSPEYEDSWVKALFADAWSTPSKVKQAINIAVYAQDNYIEFHRPISLRALIQQAQHEQPHFSPAHAIVQRLHHDFDQYKEAILGPDLSDRRNVINALMKSEAIQQAILKESIDHKISMFEAENRARGYLTEIASDFSYATLRFGELALTKLWTQLYDGIQVYHFDTVRELAKDYHLVYTPCHRSHIDYLLLSFVIFNRGLMVPHIAAGINLNLPIVGQIFRGAGAYFIRRSFNGNVLYTSVFKKYLNSLVRRSTPLEYFIEGGRSRTGLLLPPKKGMLSMTIQSHLSQAHKPIAFIPTYFGYEKLLEGTSYLNELNGKPKEAESLWGILSSVRKIEKVFGQVHVNFGEPVFLDQILEKHQIQGVRLNPHDPVPLAVKQTVYDVAHGILENINKAVVIHPIALLSLILLHSDDGCLLETQLHERIEQYRTLLEDSPYDLRMKLTDLSAHHMIEYAIQLKQVERRNQNEVATICVAEHQKNLLSYFSNNILHCLILPAVVALWLESAPLLSVHKLKQAIGLIYPYLKEDFFLKWSKDQALQQVDEILASFQRLNWLSIEDDIISSETDDYVQQQRHSFSQLAQPTLTRFLAMLLLLQKYHEQMPVTELTLEKMSKATLAQLAEQLNLRMSYFDRAHLTVLINVLLQEGLLEKQDQVLHLHAKSDALIHSLQAYLPNQYQAVLKISDFSDKALKSFYEVSKK